MERSDLMQDEKEKIHLKVDDTVSGDGAKMFGKYQSRTKLGSGGMSDVYEAVDPVLNRTVAIKVLHSNYADQETTIKRLRQEGRALSQLRHQNIVGVFDFGVTESGEPFVVMDYVQGETLSALLAGNKLSYDDKVSIFHQLAEALSHAHSKGILHRDLKPSNVIVARNDRGQYVATLVDFGIAQIVEPDADRAKRLTTTGEVLGSPLYMSPEQSRGMWIDARSDLFSLGVMMYEAFLGKPPWDGANPLEVIYKKLHDPAAAIDQSAKLPQNMQAIVLKLLANEPQDRYQSADQLLAELDGNPLPPAPQDKRVAAAKRTAIISVVAALVILIIGWSWLKAHSPISSSTEEIVLREQPITDADLLGMASSANPRKLDLADTKVTDKSAPLIARMSHLTDLGLDNTGITDNTLASLPQSVSWVSLNGCHVTNAGLESLARRLPGLRGLTLDGFPVDDTTLRILHSMPNLHVLTFRGPWANDVLLENLSSLPNLEHLAVTGSGITDEGLRSLEKYPKLKSLLLLENKNLTAKAISRLRTKLPNCKIDF